MTPSDFRKLALSLPEADEAEHMHHPDFRVRGRIFATLGYPDERHGVVMLFPEQQADAIRSHPAAFSAAKSAWGKRGSTQVLLDEIQPEALRPWIELAWRKVAPKKLAGS